MDTNLVLRPYAGSGFTGYLDGKGEETFFNQPISISINSAGVVAVADYFNGKIRLIDTDRNVTTAPNIPLSGFGILYFNDRIIVASGARVYGFGVGEFVAGGFGDGYLDGPYAEAKFGDVRDIAVDASGSIYAADRSNHRIRKLSGNQVTTIAGSGNQGIQDGKGIFSSFSQPKAITVTPSGDLIVSEQNNPALRRIAPDGTVTTFELNPPYPMAWSRLVHDTDGSLYSCRDGTGTILRIFSDRRYAVVLSVPYTLADFTIKDGVIYALSENSVLKSERLSDAPPKLVSVSDVRLLPSLMVSGEPGRSYRIDATPDMQNTNTWIAVSAFQLIRSPQRWIDESATNGTRRFYRAVQIP